MEQEIIIKVDTNNSGELFLGLDGNGKSEYQLVYREGAGVYWDNTNHGFKSTPLKKWSHSKWFSHIVSVVKEGLGVELRLSSNATWLDIPETEKEEILNENITI